MRRHGCLDSAPGHRVTHRNLIFGVNMPLVHTYQIFCDSVLQFSNGSHFDTLICNPAHFDSHRNFIKFNFKDIVNTLLLTPCLQWDVLIFWQVVQIAHNIYGFKNHPLRMYQNLHKRHEPPVAREPKSGHPVL